MVYARIALPFLLETRECSYVGSGAYSPNLYINGSTCAGSFVGALLTTSGPPATTLSSCSDWTELNDPYLFGGGTGTGWVGGLGTEGCSEDGTQFILATSRTTSEYRFKIQDPLAFNCLSPDLYQNIINGTTNGFFGQFEDFQQTETAYAVGTAPESKQICLCGGINPTSIFFRDGVGYNGTLNTIDNFSCRLFTSGIIDLGASAPSSTIFLCRDLGCEPDASSGGGGIHSQAIRVVNTQQFAVNIPLVD